MKNTIKHELKTTDLKKSSDSPELDAELLLSHILKISHEKLLASPNKEISKKQKERFKKLVKQRQKGVPVAYLVGYKEFFGYKIKVTPDVLIPRPESETILEFAIKEIKGIQKEKLTLADIGTGSGEIGLVLAKSFPKAKIIASDISKKALKLAKENLEQHDVKNAKILQSDLLNYFPKQKFDAVIANLPYLSEKVYKETQPEIKKEPKLALLAKEDGMYFYNRLIETLNPFVKKDSLLFLEIDPHQYESLKKKILELFPKSEVMPIQALSNITGKQANIGLFSSLKDTI